VIENFVAQPYPLECTADGVTWALVLGWAKIADRITPVVAPSDSPLGPVADGTALRYRVARPAMALSSRPTPAASRA
jgi:hypothetical protein